MTATQIQNLGAPPRRSRTFQRTLRALLRNGKSVAGISILIVFIALALLAPVFFPDDPSRIGSGGAHPPSAEHLLVCCTVNSLLVVGRMGYDATRTRIAGVGALRS